MSQDHLRSHKFFSIYSRMRCCRWTFKRGSLSLPSFIQASRATAIHTRLKDYTSNQQNEQSTNPTPTKHESIALYFYVFVVVCLPTQILS